MYGILASCLASCATTLVINVLIHRKRQHRRETPADSLQTPSSKGAESPLDATHGKERRDTTADAASSQRIADQEDDDFMFTPPKVKPARKPEQQQYMSSASYAMHSPVDFIKRADPYDPTPRTSYLSWDDYFMALAFLSAQRSKDPNKQVGACIVSQDHIILGIGYNGFPRGCADGQLPWAKKHSGGDQLGTKYPYVVHAEANALLNKNAAVVAGAKVYVTMFPCNECAKLLIQAGITEVVYHEDKAQDQMMPVRSLSMAEEEQQQPQQQWLCQQQPHAGHHAHGHSYAAGASSGGSAEHACYMASKRLLSLAGVTLRQHQLSSTITLCG